jgi:hypothetical protein
LTFIKYNESDPINNVRHYNRFATDSSARLKCPRFQANDEGILCQQLVLYHWWEQVPGTRIY